MTDEHRSQVSALVDGEVPGRRAARLLDLVGREPELRAAWERYHLIGQAIRGERVEREVRAVADAVRRAIEREPSAQRASRLGRGERFAPFAGAALAAGMAILAVLAVPTLLQGPEPPAWPAAPTERYAGLDATHPGRWRQARPALTDKLELFLATHQESAPGTGVKGMLPYAMLVGYDVGR
jgi:sigma-E factor negative regulatory protein RseA